MIEFRGVTKKFGESVAVADLSLRVDRGEFFVLIGPSGCGKTTTLLTINRLIEPTSGEIRIDGADASDAVSLRRRIGFVFQAIGLFPHMTVAENIAVTPRLLKWSEAETSARVKELLALVRLDPEKFAQRFPKELSGGQQQRVGLARALAAKPSIMLMDEAFGALDPITRDEVAADYKEIHKQLGLTTILVTHDVTEAFLLADRIGVMQAGRMAQIGTPHELVANPANDFVREMIETPRRRARQLADAMEAHS